MWKSAGPDYTNWTPVALPPGACAEAIAFAPATWGGAYSDTHFTEPAGGTEQWHGPF
jgi:hypothetical protein